MRLLFVGDVIGKPGRQAVQRFLPELVDKRHVDYTIVNVEQLEVFESGAVVDLAAVLQKGLTNQEAPLFKVLGDGALTKALTVRAQKFSKSAAEKIRAAGGNAVVLDARGREAAGTDAAE